ncbi:helix-turn-helix domain-containing protein [Phytohabitans rumicis]|uniref:helix-turn-helix domain-containing protein n=1 Tax=Phytohabitans rumicis TaxID=1076125 RepID=UPI00156737CB|nr:helix-turn-helix transcriptional regulator [Phytohabitans rumicis]
MSYTVSGMREAVAENVRIELARRKMSAAELARRLGVPPQNLSRRMTGETPFDTDDLVQIANEFGISVTALLPVEQTASAS